MLLIASLEFIDAYLRELVFNALRPTPVDASGSASISHVYTSLGAPLLVVTLAALPAAGCVLFHRKRHAALFSTMTWVPYGVITTLTTFYERYVPMLLPAAGPAAGVGSVAGRGSRPLRVGMAIAVVFGASVMLVRTQRLLFEFAHETRDEAAVWIRNNIPAGVSIAVPYYRPAIDPAGSSMVALPQERGPREDQLAARDRLDAWPPYTSFRAALEGLRGAVNRGQEVTPYLAWFDRMAANLRRDQESLSSGNLPPADIIVVSPILNPQLKGARFMLSPAGSLEPQVEFVNPPMLILQRKPTPNDATIEHRRVGSRRP